MSRVVLVVNPCSGGGRTGSRLAELQRLAQQVFNHAQVVCTQGVGDGIRLARDAAESGADLVVAVGGDGTANEVVNGLVRAGREAAFAVLPAGTGSDLVRTLRVPQDWSAALRSIHDAPTVPTDVMAVRCADNNGIVERFGINVVGYGMAGDVVARTNRGSKRLGGRLTFLYHTARSALAWRAPEVELSWLHEDDRPGSWSGKLMNVFLCNASWCGGGMWIAPQADMADGLMDVVIIPDAPLATAAFRSPHLYSGRISEQPDVLSMRVKWLRAEGAPVQPVPVDVDGEALGYGPLEVDCRASLLPVRVASR